MRSNRQAFPVSMRKRSGFTLIELMIAVAIIAVLVAVAYPSYQDYLKKGRRADAQGFMMDVANRQQQYLLDARSYADQMGAVACGLGLTVPSSVSPYYTITVTTNATCPNGTTFLITATAIGSQVSDGNLTLDQQGSKTPTNKW